MAVRDRDVRAITVIAVAVITDTALQVSEAAQFGRVALSALPGFRIGDALASAVLYAAAPERMAVYDRRAQQALDLSCTRRW